MSLKGILKGAGDVIEKTGEAGDKLFTSKEEKMTLGNKDRQDARDMQEESFKNSKKWTTADLLALYWSLIAGAYIFFVTFVDVPVKNQRIADTVIGFLMGTIIAAIINFFFGSSEGSKMKTKGIFKRGI